MADDEGDRVSAVVAAGSEPTVADCTALTVFQTARVRFDLASGRGHPRLDAW